MPAPSGTTSPAGWLVQGVVWVVLAGSFAAASVGFHAALQWQWQWIDRPFPRFLPHGKLVVSRLSRPLWTGAAAGLHIFGRIVEVEGSLVATGEDVLRYAEATAVRPLRYRVVSPGDVSREITCRTVCDEPTGLMGISYGHKA